jgi:hypothetical protein
MFPISMNAITFLTKFLHSISDHVFAPFLVVPLVRLGQLQFFGKFIVD